MLTLSSILAPLTGADESALTLFLLKFGLASTVFVGGISLIAMFSIWWERKVAGHIQGRLGPMHTGAWHGWAQSLADGIKLITKEDLVPAGADSFLFRLAPYLAFAPVFAAFVAIPFGPQLVFEGALANGLIYILAILAIEVVAVILAGWGSNSKWAIYGAMREACQLVSYEVPLGITLLCGVLVAGTLNLLELGYLQGAGIWDWFFYHNPFMFLALFVFFIAGLAENKRAPFDLPEAESELVSGFHTEYSGIRFSFFFFAEYAGMFITGVIIAFLFLGAWNSPLGVYDPVYYLIGYDPIEAGRAYFAGLTSSAVGIEDTAAAMGLSVPGLIVLNAYAMGMVVVKALTIVLIQIWVRWTLPRIRIDQVMFACVKVLLPMSLILLVGVACWVALVPQAAAVELTAANGTQIVVNRLGHLTPLAEKPVIQMVTQLILTVLGVGLSLAVLAVVAYAWLTPGSHPRQSMFEEVMPVGRDVSYTSSTAPDADATPA